MRRQQALELRKRRLQEETDRRKQAAKEQKRLLQEKRPASHTLPPDSEPTAATGMARRPRVAHAFQVEVHDDNAERAMKHERLLREALNVIRDEDPEPIVHARPAAVEPGALSDSLDDGDDSLAGDSPPPTRVQERTAWEVKPAATLHRPRPSSPPDEWRGFADGGPAARSDRSGLDAAGLQSMIPTARRAEPAANRTLHLARDRFQPDTGGRDGREGSGRAYDRDEPGAGVRDGGQARGIAGQDAAWGARLDAARGAVGRGAVGVGGGAGAGPRAGWDTGRDTAGWDGEASFAGGGAGRTAARESALNDTAWLDAPPARGAGRDGPVRARVREPSALEKTPTEADIDNLWSAVRRHLDAPAEPAPRTALGPRLSKSRVRAETVLARARAAEVHAAPDAVPPKMSEEESLALQEEMLLASLARLDTKITQVVSKVPVVTAPAPVPHPPPKPKPAAVRKISAAQRREHERRTEILSRYVDDPAAAMAAMMEANRQGRTRSARAT